MTKTIVDLFAGAGGLTLGFVRAGFEPVFAVDIDASAAETHAANFDCPTHVGPIEGLESFPRADVVIGGPPCQGFSPLGRSGDGKARESLNRLWREYVRALKQVKPQIFVMENVPEFLRSQQFKTFLSTCGRDEDLRGYRIEHRVLNAADFGVPQKRRRAIVIASRNGAPRWPSETHGEGLLASEPYVTVREAISDLPEVPDGVNWHIGRHPTDLSLERYRTVPAGGNRFDLARERPDLLPPCWKRKTSGATDVFGRLWWDRPACTIRTEFFKPEKGRYLHPVAHRAITHREAARLQSFPDDFEFRGSKTSVARQIGNAVPPRLAEVIAGSVKTALS